MPIERSPLNKKEEKRDYKQEFLDMVANQSGPLAAATMSDALKHQNKQMEEAMLQGGMSIADISQTVAKQVGMPPQGGTEPIQKKGNFWYQPFEMNQQTGQVTPASILGGLISQHPQDVEAMAKAQQVGKKVTGKEETKDIYSFDPYTRQITKAGSVPKSAEVYKEFLSPDEKVDLAKRMETIKRESPERVQMSSNLEVMDSLLTDMQDYLNKDPDAMVKGLNPLGQREFKAIVDSFDKVAAIAAGGKQLTATELNLIRKTRPTILDTRNPKAIEYKFNILKNTLGLAKERLNKSTQYEKKGGDGDTLKRLGLDPNKFELVRE